MDGNIEEKKACADRALLSFIYKKIKYPAIARETRIEGTVNAQFIVEKDGKITNIIITKDIGGECGTMCIKVLKEMSEHDFWVPGKKNGKPVRTQFEMPVKFRLEKTTSVNNNDSKIFKYVDEMPRFYSKKCEKLQEIQEKIDCSSKRLHDYIYQNLNYPPIASNNGVEGTPVIQFIVEKDGSLSGIRTARDIGAQCGAESIRVIKTLNESGFWTPGKKDGMPVRTQMEVPISFRLDENQKMIIPKY